MKFRNSRWTMVMVGVIAFLVLATMVSASPPAGARSAPFLVSIDAQNAHRVDNHHARPSSGTKAQRANRVLWATKQGRLHWRAMPAGQLNSRYLNDDRPETITASTMGTLLTVNNTYPGSGVGVYGYGTMGTGVHGKSTDGMGVWGDSFDGLGVFAYSRFDLPLQVTGGGTNLIEAWQAGPAGELVFKVVMASGDVQADGSFYAGEDVTVTELLRVGTHSSAPATCDGTTEGSIYYNTTNNTFYGCNGTDWQALH